MVIFGLFKPNVKKMQKERDVEGLIKALEHKNIHVRERAAEALGELKDARAVEPLILALNGEDEGRFQAAFALGRIGDKRAVEPLILALNDKNEDVREKAAKALEEIRKNEAKGKDAGTIKMR